MNPTELARELRGRLLRLHHRVHAGHIGCGLSSLELMIASLVLRKRSEDVFILSKGHAALSLYVCLHHLGELSDADLATAYQNDTRLPAHPAARCFPGIPFALGSLGHGFPIGVGVAKAHQLRQQARTTFVLMSDGETNAGTTWEAAHLAVAHQLSSLVVLIDKNGLQGFGRTEDVLGDTAAAAKWAGIGFAVATCDGHDLERLGQILDGWSSGTDPRPKVLIGETIKGKGVSFMENRLEWHYLPLSDAQFQQALAEAEPRA